MIHACVCGSQVSTAVGRQLGSYVSGRIVYCPQCWDGEGEERRKGEGGITSKWSIHIHRGGEAEVTNIKNAK